MVPEFGIICGTEAVHPKKRAVTGDTALRLAHFFGTTAEFWLNLPSLYDVRIAQKKAGKSIRRLPTPKACRTSTRVTTGRDFSLSAFEPTICTPIRTSLTTSR